METQKSWLDERWKGVDKEDCQYEVNERKISIVSPGQFSVITYNHDEWEKNYCFLHCRNTKPVPDHTSDEVEEFIDCSVRPSHSCFSPKHDSDKEQDLNDSSVSLKNCSFGSESNSSKQEDVKDSFASPKNSLFGSESDSSNEGYLNDSFVSPSNNSFSPEHDGDKEEDFSDSSVSPKNYIFSPESDSDKEEDLNDSFASPGKNSFGPKHDSDKKDYLSDSSVSTKNSSFSPEIDSNKVEDLNGSSASPSNRSLGLEYDSDSSCVAKRSKMRLTLADFLNGKLESLTRKDLASYLLPQVAFIPPEDVQIADSGAKAFNRLLANQRPSESTVQHSMDLLKGDTANLVRIGILGSFTAVSKGIWQNVFAGCRNFKGKRGAPVAI